MNVDSRSRPNPYRTVALAVFGLLFGPVLWFITLYMGAFVVSAWTDELGPAQVVGVVAELLMITILVIAALRNADIRPFLVGTTVAFTSVTLMYWTS